MNEIYKSRDWYRNAGIKEQQIIDNPLFVTPLKNQNTYLTGSYGIGKTMSCYGLLRDRTIFIYEKLLKNYEPELARIYLNNYNLVIIKHNKIKDYIYDYKWQPIGSEARSKAFYELYHEEYSIKKADLLIIDDFDKTTKGGRGDFYEKTWNDFYYSLFDYRYINNLPTIFTSNTSLKELLDTNGDNWIDGATKDRILGLVSEDYTINNTKSLRHD